MVCGRYSPRRWGVILSNSLLLPARSRHGGAGRRTVAEEPGRTQDAPKEPAGGTSHPAAPTGPFAGHYGQPSAANQGHLRTTSIPPAHPSPARGRAAGTGALELPRDSGKLGVIHAAPSRRRTSSSSSAILARRAAPLHRPDTETWLGLLSDGRTAPPPPHDVCGFHFVRQGHALWVRSAQRCPRFGFRSGSCEEDGSEWFPAIRCSGSVSCSVHPAVVLHDGFFSTRESQVRDPRT